MYFAEHPTRTQSPALALANGNNDLFAQRSSSPAQAHGINHASDLQQLEPTPQPEGSETGVQRSEEGRPGLTSGIVSRMQELVAWKRVRPSRSKPYQKATRWAWRNNEGHLSSRYGLQKLAIRALWDKYGEEWEQKVALERYPDDQALEESDNTL
jgi:hypothetical protein